jgi:molybdate transport system substrate-binding protein
VTSRLGDAPAITVLCGGALHDILDELSEAYALARGEDVAAEFATSASIGDRIRNGEAFDIVISTDVAIAKLAEEGRVLADSVAALARSAIGVAVRAGRPRPDIGSVEAFISALRRAPSIACADPALRTPSGAYLAGLFDRLGLTEELKPKMRLVGAAGGKPVVVCEALVKGEAEVGIQQISEIVAVPGVDLVGPLPPDIQHTTIFTASVTSMSRRVGPARDFVSFLAADAARPVIAAHGMEPI